MLFTRGRRQLGYACISDPDKGLPEEHDTLTCGHGHCGGKVVWMKPFEPGEAMGGHCKICDKFICLQCVGKPCTTMEKLLDKIEARRNYDEVMK